MKNAEFWNPAFYYSMWYLIVAASFGIALNLQIWETFVGGFKFRLAVYTKYLTFAFFIYNLLLIGLSYGELISGYYLWLNRSLSVAVIPVSLALAMTYINVKSYGAPLEGRVKIGIGYRMIEQEVAQAQSEQARTRLIVDEIHNS